MSLPFCNVALPVPLRTTFTYAVPESLREIVQLGARVIVPFRKKAMVGVVVELTDHAPADTKIREITLAEGMVELAPAGMEQVLAGKTTLEEVFYKLSG